LASAEHPERKSLLVDASLLIGDLPALSNRMEAAYRISYSPDRTNSFIEYHARGRVAHGGHHPHALTPPRGCPRPR
jgi:hypothetical protein